MLQTLRAPRNRPAILLLAGVGVVLLGLVLVLNQTWSPTACDEDSCAEARQWMSATATLIVILAGLYQYWRAQLWKRAEFVAAEMDKFFSRPQVRNATLMIDWSKRKVNLFEDDEPDTWPVIARETQCKALVPHTVDRERSAEEMERAREAADSDLGGFTMDEMGIRDSFDTFLDGLERFAGYVESGLVTTRDLRPYLGYWIDDVADTCCSPLDAAWTCCFMAYVQFYDYEGVQALFRSYGYDIRIPGPMFDTFKSMALSVPKPALGVDLNDIERVVREKRAEDLKRDASRERSLKRAS